MKVFLEPPYLSPSAPLDGSPILTPLLIRCGPPPKPKEIALKYSILNGKEGIVPGRWFIPSTRIACYVLEVRSGVKVQ